MTRKYIVTGPQAREAICRAAHEVPEGSCVTFRDGDRTLDQNAALWPILDAFAEQLDWPINGKRQKMTSEEWKDVTTAAFKQGERQRVAEGLDGGFVLLGVRTSKMGKREFSDYLEFLHAVAVERGVQL